jgi:uncharacterized DUF497 family protein
MNVIFEWDEDKNLANFKKHGVWFAEAQTAWADERSIEYFDSLHSTEEDRFIRIGRSAGNSARVLLTVFCERDEAKRIRLISSREATRSEKSAYEEGI